MAGLDTLGRRRPVPPPLPRRDPPDPAAAPRVPGARLLRRTVGDETEFVSLTSFDDLDAIRRFAGDDHETAVVAEEAREVLVRFDDRVRHYDTAVDA